MDSFLSLIINVLVSSILLVGGVVWGLVMQADPGTDIINLILGPMGAVVLLILAAWYFVKRDKEKDATIQQLNEQILSGKNEVIQAKDKEIERLRNRLDK